MLLPSLHNLPLAPCTGMAPDEDGPAQDPVVAPSQALAYQLRQRAEELRRKAEVNRLSWANRLAQLALQDEDAYNALVDSLDPHDKWIIVWRMIEDAINAKNVNLAIIVLKTCWRMHLRWHQSPQGQFAFQVGLVLHLWCRKHPTAIDGLARLIVALGFWYNSPQMAGVATVLDRHMGLTPAPMTKAVLMEYCLNCLVDRPDTLGPQREALRTHPLMA
jgi:hypothetical protein